ncbi:MAG: FAD-dependent oxidoreductase, partial [Bacteroidota bacterium]
METYPAYDIIIIGTGSIGSACCYYAAKSGYQVLGLDQYQVPHIYGSHSGQSRIYRTAYFEHSNYVPLLEQSYANWKQLERITNRQFLHQSGLVYFGEQNDILLRGVRYASEKYSIPIRELDAFQIKSEFPQFNLKENIQGLLEEEAGFIIADQTIASFRKLAIEAGAEIRGQNPVENF